MTAFLRSRLFGATALAGALAFASATAAQQTTPPPEVSRTNPTPGVGAPGSTNNQVSGQAGSPDAPQANNSTGEAPSGAVEEVVVTGSRIRRADLSSAQPIQVIGGQYLEEKGFTNVGDVLNQLPGVQGSITPTGDQATFGTGRNYINLFNLGSGRTLTLLNGRRFVSDNAASSVGGLAAGQQVNTNSIPTAFIDRIETVQAGGSAVYGSDAIAGVINIITKDKFRGLEVDAQYSRSDRDDYPGYRARIAAGFDFAGGRGNLAATFEYNETDVLFQTDRDRTGANYGFFTNPRNVNATDGIPSTILYAGRTVPELTPGGIPYRTNATALSQIITIPDPNNPGGRIPAQFATGGLLVPYATGQFLSTSTAIGGGGLNLASVTALQTANKRYVTGGLGSFEITPHIRLKAEFQATRVEGNEPANQPIFNSGVFGGTAVCNSTGACPNTSPAQSANILFPITNPFLPAATVAQLQGAGVSQFFLSRGSQDLVGGANSVDSVSNAYRGVISVEGDFNVFSRDFQWDVFYNHGETDGDFTNLSINQYKFANALNAVRDGAGNVVCGPVPTGLTASETALRQQYYSGCSPLNLFGNNSASAAAIGYVSQLFNSKFSNRQDNAQANIGGTIWRLPGGPLALNVGFEYRREEAKFSPDQATSLGLGRSVPIAGAKGAFDTREVYEEINVPVFGGDFTFPLMRGLELNFSNRNVWNSLAGEGRAYSYQAKYYPFRDLLIRATRSRSFRAPAVTQLFAPQSSAFSFANDPCDGRFINTGNNPAVRRANCIADLTAAGVPAAQAANFTSLVVDRSLQIVTGGNPNLQNEIAEQYSYGFVYQPKWLPNFVLSADLVNVDLTNAISNFTLQAILTTCYDQVSRPSNVCSLFQRDSAGGPIGAGQILQGALTGPVNAGFLHFQAMSVNVSYDFEPRYIKGFEGLPGRIGINVQSENYQRYESSVSGTGFDIVRSAGTFGVPRWTGQANLSYVNGPFRAIVTERYISSVRYDNTFTIENRDILSVDDYYLTDFTMNYKWKNYTARFGVNNVFDVEPPFPSVSTTYDLIGRYYFVGLNARF